MREREGGRVAWKGETDEGEIRRWGWMVLGVG